MGEKLTVIHISDLHIKEEMPSDQKDVLDKLFLNIKDTVNRLQFKNVHIVVSGDLAKFDKKVRVL